MLAHNVSKKREDKRSRTSCIHMSTGGFAPFTPYFKEPHSLPNKIKNGLKGLGNRGFDRTRPTGCIGKRGGVLGHSDGNRGERRESIKISAQVTCTYFIH
jgi:hypothetical protein